MSSQLNISRITTLFPLYITGSMLSPLAVTILAVLLISGKLTEPIILSSANSISLLSIPQVASISYTKVPLKELSFMSDSVIFMVLLYELCSLLTTGKISLIFLLMVSLYGTRPFIISDKYVFLTPKLSAIWD